MSDVMEAGGAAAAADKGKMIYNTDLIEPIQCQPCLASLIAPLTLANEPADFACASHFHAHAGFICILFTSACFSQSGKKDSGIKKLKF